MAKRMLIDATHPEETRVVVVNGNRLEEFDVESSTKQQVKGNIYLAKVTRVEPSLQAAFVEYGGNRHGFLAFSEIHPDYFRIPVGDRTVGGREFIHSDSEAAVAAGEPSDEAGVPLEMALPELVAVTEGPPDGEDESDADDKPAASVERTDIDASSAGSWVTEGAAVRSPVEEFEERAEATPGEAPWVEAVGDRESVAEVAAGAAADDVIVAPEETPLAPEGTAPALAAPDPSDGEVSDAEVIDAEVIETLGGDEFEDAEHQRSRAPRHYKIQEVIKRRQIMLVQVTKEERGNKGAALTSYLSLAGRYCVLMPNTARGGGVSRKITSISDRRRLKEILEELDIPEGMGVIVRTAGAERSKPEIKRDYEYLLRLWNEIRELTLKSTAPALIYEEGNLIKRSIRDLYTRDIDEVLVEGEEGYRTAKSFMKMLMPSHAKRVQPYRDPQIGLLHRFQVEGQIDAIHSPIVQLRSGGYVVINQTEALVAIDVNSGRSTRERNIEETALRTNLEAAEEIARQLRLRDLAGLIVIDFIDMEEHRNQGAVERRLKDALKNDRARIQVGRISPFGLLEMSRQRLRPSLVEASTQPCPHCGGTGFIRSTESTALYVLRSIEEEGMRRRSAEVCVYVPTTVALYILNHKRDSLLQLEARYGIHVLMAQDDALIPPAFRLERLRAYGPSEAPAIPAPLTQAPAIDEEEPEEDEVDEAFDADAPRPSAESDEERGHSRRRRRRRRRHEDEAGGRGPAPAARAIEVVEEEGEHVAIAGPETGDEPGGEEDGDGDRQRRRRGRRGGRRRPRREDGTERSLDDLHPIAATVEIVATTDDGELGPDEFEVAEGAQATAEMEMLWPAELSREPGVEVAGTEIETASLPALAGEPAGATAPSHNGSSQGEPAEAQPALGIVEELIGHNGRADQRMHVEDMAPLLAPALGVEDSSPAEPAEAQPALGTVEESIGHNGGADQGIDGEDMVPRLAPAPGVEDEPSAQFATEQDDRWAPPPAPEPAAMAPSAEPVRAVPAETVQAITEKPENPRKGWWQRLMQS
jgi:ribonuclease E